MTPSSPPRVATAGAVALALLCSGCAHRTEVSRTWSDPGLGEAKYRRVMVFALLPHQGKRRTVEQQLVAELTGQGVDAIRSWDVLPEELVGDRERIREVVEANGADALLALRVANVDRDRDVSAGRQQWVPVATGMDYFGYVGTTYGLYRKPEVEERATVTVETSLWDAASARMVWAAQSDSSTSKEPVTTADVAKDYAKVVVKKVRPYLRAK